MGNDAEMPNDHDELPSWAVASWPGEIQSVPASLSVAASWCLSRLLVRPAVIAQLRSFAR